MYLQSSQHFYSQFLYSLLCFLLKPSLIFPFLYVQIYPRPVFFFSLLKFLLYFNIFSISGVMSGAGVTYLTGIISAISCDIFSSTFWVCLCTCVTFSDDLTDVSIICAKSKSSLSSLVSGFCSTSFSSSSLLKSTTSILFLLSATAAVLL